MTYMPLSEYCTLCNTQHAIHTYEVQHEPTCPTIQPKSVAPAIGILASDVFKQANRLFPDRTDSSMYLKLYAETAEVIDSKGRAEEVADVLIMWLDYAVRKGINIEEAIRAKMAINEKRTWEFSNGVFQHVE